MKAFVNSMIAAVLLVASFTASSAVFSFDQSEYDVVVGETFEVTLLVDTEMDSIAFFDLGLTFNNMLIEFFDGNLGANWALAGVSLSSDSFAGSLNPFVAPLDPLFFGFSGSAIEIATFTFTALTAGQTSLAVFANDDFSDTGVENLLGAITELSFNTSSINVSEVSAPSIAFLALLGGFACLIRRKLV